MSASIDTQTVSALADEPMTWRWRGFPREPEGTTVAEFLESGPRLATSGFTGPLLVLDRPAVQHNVATFADWCEGRGVSLAPHGKTTMAPQLFAAQIAAGAWGITVATVSQARVCREFGIGNVVIANQLLDPTGLRWVSNEIHQDPGCRILFWVDSLAGVRAANGALAGLRPARPLEVLVELGVPGRRSGCRRNDEAVAVATAVDESPWLQLKGVAGYEGVAGDVAQVDHFLGRMVDLTHRLDRAGLFAHIEEVIVTAGGSMFFDRVAEILGGLSASRPVRTLLRSGCYVTHDDGIYAQHAPWQRGVAGSPDLRPALTIWAQVTSQPEDCLAILTMGKRDVAYDEGFPVPRVLNRDGMGGGQSLPGAEVIELNDQHTYVRFAQSDALQLGDWVGFGISHPCSMFDRWSAIPMVEDDIVVDVVRTFF